MAGRKKGWWCLATPSQSIYTAQRNNNSKSFFSKQTGDLMIAGDCQKCYGAKDWKM
jgi:hypothetical protein